MAYLIDLKTFIDVRGNLTVIEKTIPFDIKRIFYIYGVDQSRAWRSQAQNNHTGGHLPERKLPDLQ